MNRFSGLCASRLTSQKNSVTQHVHIFGLCADFVLSTHMDFIEEGDET